MIFFKTRHEIRKLNLRVQILERNLDRFFNTYNGTINLVNEVQKLMHEHSADIRSNRGGTFKLNGLTPDYGENWKKEESKLNHKDKK